MLASVIKLKGVLHTTSPTRSELKLHVCMGSLSCGKGIPHLDHDALKGGGDHGSHYPIPNNLETLDKSKGHDEPHPM